MRERELQTDKSTKTNESTKSSAKFFSFFDRMHLLWCRNASASPPQSLSRGVAEGAHARKDHTGSPRQPSPEAADEREPSPERADAREPSPERADAREKLGCHANTEVSGIESASVGAGAVAFSAAVAAPAGDAAQLSLQCHSSLNPQE